MVAPNSPSVNGVPVSQVDPKSEQAIVASAMGVAPSADARDTVTLSRPIARHTAAIEALAKAADALQYLQAHEDGFWRVRGPYEPDPRAEAVFIAERDQRRAETIELVAKLRERFDRGSDELHGLILGSVWPAPSTR